MSTNQELKRLQDDFAAKRITRRQLWKGAAALGVSGMWIAALERGAIAGPAPVRNQLLARGQDAATTFIIAVEGDVDTFDPGNTVGSKTAQTTLQNVFDQLTQYQIIEGTTPDGQPYRTVDTTQIVPMIAEEWHWDGPNMVFTIRDGVTYANGDPIDANTHVAGYTRILEGTVSSWLIGMGGTIADSSAFQAPDAKTFVIALTQQNPITPRNNVMHNNSVLNPLEVEANATEDDPWAAEYYRQNLAMGNGPYKLDAYLPGDSITLTANELYYGEQPFFTTVILKIVTEPVQRVQLLQQGDVDFATLLPRTEIESLSADPNLKVLTIPSPFLTMLSMNNKMPPFDNKLVRQAVNYAAPYQVIIDEVYKGNAQPGGSLVPNGMPTSDFSTNPYTTDLEKAKALLSEAGFPDGEGLPEIKLSYRIGDAAWERMAILMQAQLANIGMDITIEPLAYAVYNEQQQAEGGSKMQFWIDEWLSWVNDPYYHMTWLAHSGSSNNYPKMSIPRVDEIIDTYTIFDEGEERDAASVEAQALIIDDATYCYLCQPNWLLVTRADIDGYVYYNDELPRYYHFNRVTA
ncbi:ABC transporter substrate-binding protein [soil metagenome]